MGKLYVSKSVPGEYVVRPRQPNVGKPKASLVVTLKHERKKNNTIRF